MFWRDELDLVEEEFDDIFHRHDHSTDRASFRFEEDVLREHLDTEEGSEAEIMVRVGPRPPALERTHEPHADMDALHGSLREQLRRDVVRDPFYEAAFVWASDLFRWSGRLYERQELRTRDLFRVHVNAYLVPAKIAAAQTEETHEEHGSFELALCEYGLAATYLQRTCESLRALPNAPASSLAEAHEIGQRIEQARRRLEQMRNFRADL